MASSPPPTVGRIVHFTLGHDDHAYTFVLRPAMIVAVHPDERVDLQVFTNAGFDDPFLQPDESSSRDGRGRARSVVHRTDVPRQELVEVANRWSWPPRVGP